MAAGPRSGPLGPEGLTPALRVTFAPRSASPACGSRRLTARLDRSSTGGPGGGLEGASARVGGSAVPGSSVAEGGRPHRVRAS
jgi:hypothetical protein